MTLVESVPINLGTHMPEFRLANPEGKFFSSSDLKGEKGLVVAFTCNHCPYAIAIWPRLIRLSLEAEELGVNFVAINSNIHPNYPEDAPDKMQEKINEWRIPFEYLIDETQEVARAYDAQCTPDLYLMNAQSELIYHGRLDNNWKDADQVTSMDLKKAIMAMSEGSEIPVPQHPSMGCSIKWK